MNKNNDLNTKLQQYIEEKSKRIGRDASSLEELNIWVAEFMEGYNRRTIDEFEGYSPEDMNEIIHNFWNSGKFVQFKKLADKYFEQIPIFRQVKCLLSILLRDGKIKLTATGALPVKLLPEIYSQGIPNEYIERDGGKIRREAECNTVEMTHILAKVMRIVKVQKNVMTLTKQGKKLANDNQALLELMIVTYSTKVNFAYFDRCESEHAAGLGNGFSLILMAKYGAEERSYKFYAEKYYSAFPSFIEEFTGSHSTSEHWAAFCYELRTFKAYLENFGLIERRKTGSYMEMNNDVYVRKSSLFDKLFEIQYPR